MKSIAISRGKIAQGLSCGRFLIFIFLLLLQSALSSTATTATAAAATTTTASFPNPQTNPDACHGDANTTSRVCDVDGMLGLSQMREIQRAIVQYEALNVTCHEQEVLPLQMAVFVMDRMKAPSGANLAKLAQQTAEQIHNEWGVGYQTDECGGTGVLLFLSLGDHQMYISRGKAVKHMLTDNRLTYVMDRMKPDLQNHEYGTAVVHGIHLLTAFMAGQRPGWDESKHGFLGFLAMLSVFGILIKGGSWYQHQKRRKEKRLRDQFRHDLSKFDRDQARALQGKYQATSCPICLEDFTTTPNRPQQDCETQILLDINHNHNNPDGIDDPEEGATLYGCDGKPVQLLSCGHVFDQKCWNEFAGYSTQISPPHTGRGGGDVICCPICRQTVTTTTLEEPMQQQRILVDDPSYQEERRFRLQRLRYRYPTFVGTQYVDQWYDPYHRGSMVEAYDRWERERQIAARRAAEQAARHGSSAGGYATTSSGGFGGGSADGGGVGSSW